MRRLLLLSDLFLLQIAEGLGCGIQGQDTVLTRHNRDVIQGHDARQLGDIGRESTKIVIAAIDLHCNRQFGIELFDLLGARAEEIELQPTTEASLVHFDQQGLHFRFVWQLLEQCAERAIDLRELFYVEVKIEGLALFVQVLLFQGDLFVLLGLEL